MSVLGRILLSVVLLAGGCASAPAAAFVRTPDAEIATPPRAIVEPQPTRPEEWAPDRSRRACC